MPIDASIYGNLKPVQMPSMLDSQQKAATMSSLAMQQVRGMKQMETEDKEAKFNDHLRKASTFGNALEGLAGLPEQERAAAWEPMRQELLKSGVMAEQDIPGQYDPNYFAGSFRKWSQSKEGIENRLKVAQIGKAEAEARAAGPMAQLEVDYKKSQIAKNNADAKKEGGPKQLPADKVLIVSEGQRLPTMLEDIKATIGSNKDAFGPISGRLSSMNPYNERSSTMDAQLRAASQSFGRFMEGGVLRKEDEDKYRKMFPTLSDTPEVAANKLTIVDRLLKQKQAADVEALGASGYDTAAFGKTGRAPDAPSVLSKAQPKVSNDLIPSATAADKPPIKQGAIEDGFVFMGGDPGDSKNWKRAK